MKPVGKLDAGNPHVQFDERGWETGRGDNQLSYRAHPRLYPNTICRTTSPTKSRFVRKVSRPTLVSKAFGLHQASRGTLFKRAVNPRHQRCKNDRHEEERRRISYQMAAFGRIVEGLNAHDCPVNHTRPHGEPDNALVCIG